MPLCAQRAGAWKEWTLTLAQFLRGLEELEIVGGLVLLGIAVGAFALGWFFLALACRKFGEKSTPCDALTIRMMYIVLGCAFGACGPGDHSATEGIMYTMWENIGEGYAFRHFDQWPFFFQLELRLICLNVLPILVYDSIIWFCRAGLCIWLCISWRISSRWSSSCSIRWRTFFIPWLFAMIPYQLLDDFEGIASARQKEKKKQEARLLRPMPKRSAQSRKARSVLRQAMAIA